MEDTLCPLCGIGFKGVEPKHIFSTECSCKDSKYHSGCLNENYNFNYNKGKKIFKCPICSKSIPMENIKTFIDQAKGKIPKKSYCNCLNCLQHNLQNIHIMIVTIVFIIWFSYINYQIAEQFEIEFNCNSKDKESISHDCNNKAIIGTLYGFRVLFNLLYIIAISSWLYCSKYNFIQYNFIQYNCVILFMICVCIAWKPISKTNIYRGHPNTYTFCLNFSIFIVFIIIYGIICLFIRLFTRIYNKCLKLSVKDRNSPYLKNGYDYEDELELETKLEIESETKLALESETELEEELESKKNNIKIEKINESENNVTNDIILDIYTT